MAKKIIICIAFLLLGNTQAANFPRLHEFIADTLMISLPLDSLCAENDSTASVHIIDDRGIPGNQLGIRQITKWKYIPVDQYLLLRRPLSELLYCRLQQEGIADSGTLHIKALQLWSDSKPVLGKGRKLNVYTTYSDPQGNIAGDRIWELTQKAERKQKDAEVVAILLERWIEQQAQAIRQHDFRQNIYPHLYRRQFLSWSNVILMRDGYALDVHLTLDYPADQFRRYVRGSPGMYYRRSSRHESIAVGGKDQHWYFRLNRRWLGRLNVTARMGFNSFDADYFGHVDYWNLLFLNIGAGAVLEYRPVYLKGIFGGLGIYQSFNILPDNINRYEIGLAISLGVLLP